MTAPQIAAAGPAVPSRLVRAGDVLAFEWTTRRSVRSNYVTLIIAAMATIGSTALVAHAVASAPTPPQSGPITALSLSFLGYAEYPVIPVSVLAVLQFTSEYTTRLIR